MLMHTQAQGKYWMPPPQITTPRPLKGGEDLGTVWIKLSQADRADCRLSGWSSYGLAWVARTARRAALISWALRYRTDPPLKYISIRPITSSAVIMSMQRGSSPATSRQRLSGP